jgi:DNA-binding transcriptional LysR family regulator
VSIFADTQAFQRWSILQKSGPQRLMNTLTNLDLRQVRYAVTLADELHFGRAAARLDISQQTLSAQIRQLEKNIGTVLFIRDRRHVEVTRAGSVFVATGRMLLIEADDMLTEIAQHSDRLRVDVEMESLETPMLISEEVFGAVDDMLPEIREGHGFAAALPNLLAGEIDVTFGWLAPGERLPRGIARTLVRRQPINILLPRKHPLAAAQETRLTDLRRFPVDLRAAARDAGRHARAAGDHPRRRGHGPPGADEAGDRAVERADAPPARGSRPGPQLVDALAFERPGPDRSVPGQARELPRRTPLARSPRPVVVVARRKGASHRQLRPPPPARR